MIKNTKISATTLITMPFFAGLSRTDLEEIAGLARGRCHDAKSEIVAQHGNDDGVYWVMSGIVRVACYGGDGRMLSFRELGGGEMFGEISAIDHGSRSARVAAVTNAVVLRMSSATFLTVLERHPILMNRLLLKLTSLVRALSERAVEFSTMNVKSRIRAELHRLARRTSQTSKVATIARPPGHAEVAARVATHREAVCRELSHLNSIGLLDSARRDEWIIKDYDELGEMVRKARGY